MMFDSLKFKAFHNIKNPSLLYKYKWLMNNKEKSLEELISIQDKQIVEIIKFVYNHVPFYRNIMKEKNIRPEDVNSRHDLSKFPIINKNIIKENYNNFIPDIECKYIIGHTGGTTGNPLTYRMSINDNLMSKAILWRGWGYAGYDLGDRVAVIAGGSILNIRIFFKSLLKCFRIHIPGPIIAVYKHRYGVLINNRISCS